MTRKGNGPISPTGGEFWQWFDLCGDRESESRPAIGKVV